MLVLLLLVLATVLLSLRAFGVNGARVDLGWLGLAAFLLAQVIGGLAGVDL